MYLTLLEALRTSCHLPSFPEPLPSTQLDLELEGGSIVTIDFEEERESVSIFSKLGTYRLEEEISILKKMAEANFLWEQTNGATLSARPEEQTVYLAYEVPVAILSEAKFVECVEKFVITTQEWKKILVGGASFLTGDSSKEENSTPLSAIENFKKA